MIDASAHSNSLSHTFFKNSHGAHGAKGLCLQSDYRHGSGTYAHCGKANASKTCQSDQRTNHYTDPQAEMVPMPAVARQKHQRHLSLRVSTMACTLIRVSSRSFIVR